MLFKGTASDPDYTGIRHQDFTVLALTNLHKFVTRTVRTQIKHQISGILVAVLQCIHGYMDCVAQCSFIFFMIMASNHHINIMSYTQVDQHMQLLDRRVGACSMPDAEQVIMGEDDAVPARVAPGLKNILQPCQLIAAQCAAASIKADKQVRCLRSVYRKYIGTRAQEGVKLFPPIKIQVVITNYGEA